MIRKCSLTKGMFSTKISLAKGIRSKTGAAHPRQNFFGVHYRMINGSLTILKHWPLYLCSFTEMKTWMNNYIRSCGMQIFIYTQFQWWYMYNYTGVEVTVWMSGYNPVFNVDEITFTCLNLDGGLANS